MAVWKRRVGVLGMVLVLIGMCSIGVAQIDITLPWGQPGTYTGDTIDFAAVFVGQTKTATYTFKILETSDTSVTVRITRPNAPFGSDAPTHSFTLAPGQSITFNVTFTPTAIGNYTGSFTITAQGGYPVQVKEQTVTLIGAGILSGYEEPTEPTQPPIPWPTQPTTPTQDVTQDVIKLEAKLDTVGKTLDELRQKLDNLGWWLGKLTAGFPLGIEPHSTNPMPETNIWELLAKLEAKLDRLVQRPSEVTAPDINITIIEIYNIIVEINQVIINLGGNVDKLEAKLDELSTGQYDLAKLLGDILSDLFDMSSALGQLSGDLNSAIGGLQSAIAGLQNAMKADLTGLANTLNGLANSLAGIGNTLAGIAAGVTANGIAIGINGGAIANNALGIADNGRAIAANFDKIEAVSGLVARLEPLIKANGTAIAANATAIAENGAGIQANATAIKQLMGMFQNLQDSNNRLEDKLNQHLGYPAAANPSKIILTMGGGPIPTVPWEATVEGSAGAVQANALVTIYWPIAAPPSTVTADANGAFSFTMTTGNISYQSVEVTQTVGGHESARVRIPAS